MKTSLFIEKLEGHVAFYINGDLQFNTSDEAIYHEYLVIPALSLAIQRFPQTELKVLVCGGGDGLAARDILRLEEVKFIDLVDYNPDIIKLAKTVFTPYNHHSLSHPKITITIREAFEFIRSVPDQSYHLIICDFTYPTCSEDTIVYSQEWFQQIQRVLVSGGVFSTNGVSPNHNSCAFWCLYQTIPSANLRVKPLQVQIPSFLHHGYGNWGFLLGSTQSITVPEIQTIAIPPNLNRLTLDEFLIAFRFPERIAKIRKEINIHTINYPQFFYYLLNPSLPGLEKDRLQSTTDFLTLEETGVFRIERRDPLKLSTILEQWLANSHLQPNAKNGSEHNDINQILPIQHRYHSKKINQDFLSYTQKLLAEIDLEKLIKSLLEKSQKLPPKIASELKQLALNLKNNQSMTELSPRLSEFLMALSLTLLFANLSHPDSVFAKGYWSGGSSGSGENDFGSEGNDLKGLGLMLVIGGGFGLFNNLLSQNNQSNND